MESDQFKSKHYTTLLLTEQINAEIAEYNAENIFMKPSSDNVTVWCHLYESLTAQCFNVLHNQLN